MSDPKRTLIETLEEVLAAYKKENRVLTNEIARLQSLADRAGPLLREVCDNPACPFHQDVHALLRDMES